MPVWKRPTCGHLGGYYSQAMRSSFLLPILALGACNSAPMTGEPLADRVVSQEANWGTQCVELHATTRILAEDSEGPPAMTHPSSFSDAGAQVAAASLKMDWREAPELPYETFGEVVSGRCVMKVHRPAISEDFAFVGFSEPGGQRGTYVFRRVGRNWVTVERTVQGFW